ncbi:hypothetical protein MTR_6g027520 [Medicago truncatula]|uniref:Uncharacterized protein n=1 Tax=Medicago truncatula TaxID=3880 RepID=A0A072U840_MEDTR|nr:hypothetical protein MTR_6g027520 [Medicago truncatula]
MFLKPSRKCGASSSCSRGKTSKAVTVGSNLIANIIKRSSPPPSPSFHLISRPSCSLGIGDAISLHGCIITKLLRGYVSSGAVVVHGGGLMRSAESQRRVHGWFGSKGRLLLAVVLQGVDGSWIVHVLADDSYVILEYPSHLVD